MRPRRSPGGGRPWIAVVGMALATLAAACATSTEAASPRSTAGSVAGSSPTVTGDAATTSAPTTAAAPSTTPPAPTTVASTAPPQPITLAFGGDVHGEPPIAGVLARGDNPLGAMSGPLGRADVAMVNLETTVGVLGSPQDKEFTFRADPRLLDAVRDAGVDVVSVANNHSWDFGREAFAETLEEIAARGLQAVGGGKDAVAAYAPAIFDVRGTLVAFIGLAKVGPGEDGRASATRPGTTNGRDIPATVAAVRAAREIAPIVVVMVHWGTELATCPRADDRDLAARLVQAGATVVVGAHPHVLQGWERPPGRLIAYSLGNFVFYARRPEARATGVLTVTVDPGGDVLDARFDPARIDGEGRPVPLEGPEADAARAALDALHVGGRACP